LKHGVFEPTAEACILEMRRELVSFFENHYREMSAEAVNMLPLSEPALASIRDFGSIAEHEETARRTTAIHGAAVRNPHIAALEAHQNRLSEMAREARKANQRSKASLLLAEIRNSEKA